MVARAIRIPLALCLSVNLFAAQPSGRRPVRPRVPDTVQLTADISYAGTDNLRQKLDLLLPKKRTKDSPLPVIAFIHGGAWLAGDKRSAHRRLAGFVSTGDFAGVSIGYRLSQEKIWPAQIHDCKAAIRWIHGNAKKYGLDAERIAVWGASAGGHLVAMLGTMMWAPMGYGMDGIGGDAAGETGGDAGDGGGDVGTGDMGGGFGDFGGFDF